MVKKIKHKCTKCDQTNYLKENEIDRTCWFCYSDALEVEDES